MNIRTLFVYALLGLAFVFCLQLITGEGEPPRHDILDTAAQERTYGELTPYHEAEQQPMTYPRLKQEITENDVAAVVVYENHQGKRAIYSRHRDGTVTITPVLRGETLLQDVIDLLDERDIPYSFEENNSQPGSVMGTIIDVIFFIFIVGMIFFLFNIIRKTQSGGGQGGGGLFGMKKSPVIKEENPTTTLDDVGGIDHIKPELEQVVERILTANKLGYLGSDVPKGYLFMGPPGTGKTLLARAIAGEVNQRREGGKPVTFFHGTASDFVQMFVGVGAARVRDTFEKARQHAPCVIFFDEIDSFGKRDDGKGVSQGNDEREQTLNQLLAEINGYTASEGVTVIGATNLPDKLDPALTRPGRLDRKVSIPLPDLLGREQILNIHADNLRRRALKIRVQQSGSEFDSGDPAVNEVVNAPLPENNHDLPEVFARDVDFNTVARETPGCSGADLESILKRAAEHAENQRKKLIGLADIRHAFQTQVLGDEMPRVMDFVDEYTIAVHEILGHGLLKGYTRKTLGRDHADDVMNMTIIPRGFSLGAVWSAPTKDRVSQSRKYLEGQLRIGMGGQIAEKIFLAPDEVTTGASHDIEQVTKIARMMVSQCAMTESSELTFRNYIEEAGMTVNKANADIVDREINALLDLQYNRATAIMLSYAAKTDDDGNNLLEMLARAMLVKKTLQGNEFMRLLEGEVVFPREALNLGENEAEFVALWQRQENLRQATIHQMVKEHPAIATEYGLSAV